MARIADAGHDVVYVHTGRFVGRQITAFVRRSLRLANGAQRAAYDPIDSRRARADGVEPRPVGASVPTCGPNQRGADRIGCWTSGRTRSSDRILWLYDPCFAACIGKVG